MTLSLSAFRLSQSRCPWDDGTFSGVYMLRFPLEGFAFTELDQ